MSWYVKFYQHMKKKVFFSGQIVQSKQRFWLCYPWGSYTETLSLWNKRFWTQVLWVLSIQSNPEKGHRWVFVWRDKGLPWCTPGICIGPLLFLYLICINLPSKLSQTFLNTDDKDFLKTHSNVNELRQFNKIL